MSMLMITNISDPKSHTIKTASGRKSFVQISVSLIDPVSKKQYLVYFEDDSFGSVMQVINNKHIRIGSLCGKSLYDFIVDHYCEAFKNALSI